MIYSRKQYNVSKIALEKLKTALETAENRLSDQVWLKQAETDALRSQIGEIEEQISEYELLTSEQIPLSKVYSLEELPRVLVQARVASGMSQTDLAEKLDIKPQQIQRYEATEYMGASLARLIEIARVLGVKSSGTFEGTRETSGSVFVWRAVDEIAWGQLPYKEMIKRKWFDFPRNADPLEKVKEYVLRAAGPRFVTAYHRKKMHSGNVPNEYALLAWQARVLERSRDLAAHGEIAEFEVDDSWLPELVRLTKRKDGARRARRFLAKKGIGLIIERHLPGTYLDGAAMLDNEDRPVIGLTLRYDRLDNFWFVLLHELGHVFLHLFDGLRFDFFDEESASGSDSVEVEADEFALNALIPEKLWDQCLSRFALSEESVRIDAENIGIDPSIIAGRIRKELNDFTILNELVGQGRVRQQFEEAVDDLD